MDIMVDEPEDDYQLGEEIQPFSKEELSLGAEDTVAPMSAHLQENIALLVKDLQRDKMQVRESLRNILTTDSVSKGDPKYLYTLLIAAISRLTPEHRDLLLIAIDSLHLLV